MSNSNNLKRYLYSLLLIKKAFYGDVTNKVIPHKRIMTPTAVCCCSDGMPSFYEKVII